MNVKRLNHAVLWVRDARASAAFYGDALGFQVVEADPSGRAVFMRAGGSDNHHDLGLFSVGERPSPAPGTPGLYHLAWQVDTIEDLAAAGAAAGAGLARRRHRPRSVQEPLRQGPRRHRVRGDVAGADGPVGRRRRAGRARTPRPPGRAGPLGRRPHGLSASEPGRPCALQRRDGHGVWGRSPQGMNGWSADVDRVGVELEAAVVDVGQHVAGEQVALGGVRVAGEDEGLDAGVGQLVDLGQHLVGVADDGGAGAGAGPADAGPQVPLDVALVVGALAQGGLAGDAGRRGVERPLADRRAGVVVELRTAAGGPRRGPRPRSRGR